MRPESGSFASTLIQSAALLQELWNSYAWEDCAMVALAAIVVGLGIMLASTTRRRTRSKHWLRAYARRRLPPSYWHTKHRALVWLRGRPSKTKLAQDGKVDVVEWSYEPAWALGLAGTFGLTALATIVAFPELQGYWYRERLPGKELPLYIDEARRTVLQFWGGTVVIVGLYFGWQRMLATEETNRIERERNATERFGNAVDKLGHADIAVRCGAMYTLERFAIETPQMAWTVTEILNRFVRGRTLEHKPFQDDVQTALTVMGRRPWIHLEQSHHQIELSGLHLVGYDFSRGRFKRCVARNTVFAESRLYFADMRDADLRGANFFKANAGGLNISNANAKFSIWVGADMDGMTATKTQLKKAGLRKAWARFGNWRGALLDRSNFQLADIQRVQFQGSRFHGAILDDAVLDDSNLSGADLSGASLTRTSLARVSLSEAKLRKADFRSVLNLVEGQLAAAQTDETTTLPGT